MNENDLVVIRNRFVVRMLQVLTWVTAAMVIVGFVFRGRYVDALLISEHLSRRNAIWIETGILMFLSGLLFACLALVAFQLLTRRVPEYVETLSKRNFTDLSKELKDQLNRWFNCRGQYVFGLIFAALVLLWSPDPLGSIASSLRLTQVSPLVSLFEVFATLIQYPVAFILGLAAWRLLVIGWCVWRLEGKTSINPQPGHPDGCGGLEPLGNLCLWNAVIISIAGVFLGGWIILTYLPPSDALGPYIQQALYFRELFLILLLIPVIVSGISFFGPLWSVHQAMSAKRREMQGNVDKLAQQITATEQSLLNAGDPQKWEELNKKLKAMEEVYQRYQQYPDWPFNVKMLSKLITAQLVPVLAWAGMSDKVANVIKGLLG